MKARAMITITGRQQSGGEKDSVELTTQGLFYRRGGSYFIIYDESSLTGMEGSRTTLRVWENGAAMTRTGPFPSTLTLEPGRRRTGPYSTPYGSLELTAVTHELENGLTDGGGRVYMAYDLEQGGCLLTSNSLTVEVAITETLEENRQEDK